MHVRDSLRRTNTIVPGYKNIFRVVTLLSCYIRCKKLCDAERDIIISLKRYIQLLYIYLVNITYQYMHPLKGSPMT